MYKVVVRNAGYIAFGVALMAMVGSLLMSEVIGWIPCLLCWYQRIAMYPLVVIIGVAVIQRSKDWMLTTLILGGAGWLVALYHSLLQWKIIPEAMAPCTLGVSCVTEQLNLLGFITIPFLSLMAFTVILGMAAISMKEGVSND